MSCDQCHRANLATLTDYEQFLVGGSFSLYHGKRYTPNNHPKPKCVRPLSFRSSSGHWPVRKIEKETLYDVSEITTLSWLKDCMFILFKSFVSGWRSRKTHPLHFYSGSDSRQRADAPSQGWVHLEAVDAQRDQRCESLHWVSLLCALIGWMPNVTIRMYILQSSTLLSHTIVPWSCTHYFTQEKTYAYLYIS